MTFNDKVVYRCLRGRDPILKIFCDKLRMREFVAERLGAESLPRLLMVSEDPSQLSALTGPYILKANHESGLVTIVGQGEVLSHDQLAEAAAWLGRDFPWEREWGYRGARRALLAEELLRSPDGSSPPPDYKLFTFDGQVRMIQFVTGRFTAHHSWTLKGPDWRDIAASYGGRRALDDGQPPAHLDRMIEWAWQLGQGVDFVRVDMYDVGDRVLVGELTPYPAAGKNAFDPAATDAWLGRFWRRPQATW
ncbi:MAG: ATP-grasp fold amidoligase family protein [Candidatus Dormiibacterota bacterium]